MLLYVEEEIFFNGYLHLCCKGRPNKYGDLCCTIGPGKPSLKLRHWVYSFAYQVILYSKQDHNRFTWCTAIVCLRRVSATILWQRTTPVIVGRFAGWTWKILRSGVHSFPHFCVIFTVYTQIMNVAECCIPKPGGTGVEYP
jgi:hypothetical protein